MTEDPESENYTPYAGSTDFIYRAWCTNCLRYYDREEKELAVELIHRHVQREEAKGCSLETAKLQTIPSENYQHLPRGFKKLLKESYQKYGITQQDLSTSKEVVRGNDEVAYWIKHSNADPEEIIIAVQIKHERCPRQNCPYRLVYESHYEWQWITKMVEDEWGKREKEVQERIYFEANNKRPPGQTFHEIFDHFIGIHYDLLSGNHKEYDNIAYGMLQQLIKWEVNCQRGRVGRPRHKGHYDKRCEVIYTLNSEHGLPLGLIGEIVNGREGQIGLLGGWAYRGMLLVKGDIPQWAKNVYTKLEAENK